MDFKFKVTFEYRGGKKGAKEREQLRFATNIFPSLDDRRNIELIIELSQIHIYHKARMHIYQRKQQCWLTE